MVEWVLILWMSTNDWRGGVAVHHIAGFKSQQACVAAGQIVEKRPPVYLESGRQATGSAVNFSCVER